MKKRRKGTGKSGRTKTLKPEIVQINEAIHINSETRRKWRNLASAVFVARETNKRKTQIATALAEIEEMAEAHKIAPAKVAAIDKKQAELTIRKQRLLNKNDVSKLKDLLDMLGLLGKKIEDKGGVVPTVAPEYAAAVHTETRDLPEDLDEAD